MIATGTDAAPPERPFVSSLFSLLPSPSSSHRQIHVSIHLSIYFLNTHLRGTDACRDDIINVHFTACLLFGLNEVERRWFAVDIDACAI